MGKVNGILKGLLISYGVTVILLLLLTFFVYNFGLNNTYLNVAIYVVYGIANIIAGYITARSNKIKRVLWGIVSGVSYFMILLLCSFVLSQGKIDNAADMVIGLIICILAGAAGGFFAPVE